MISRDMAIELAQGELPNSSNYEVAKLANTIYQNNTGDWHVPFCPDEIAFIGFVDFIMTRSQDERDLIYLSENLCRVHKMVHISVGVMGEKLNDYNLQQVKEIYDLLVKFNLTHLLFDELSDKLKQWVISLSNEGRPAEPSLIGDKE